jgi:tagaturonate epimerase
LRALAGLDAPLFLDIYRFARDRYETDKASYHISGRLDRAPDPDAMPGSALPEVLDQFDARQILHVTFGSVLTATDERGRSRFAAPLAAVLESHREAYAATLERHFVKHLAPFAAASAGKDDRP